MQILYSLKFFNSRAFIFYVIYLNAIFLSLKPFCHRFLIYFSSLNISTFDLKYQYAECDLIRVRNVLSKFCNGDGNDAIVTCICIINYANVIRHTRKSKARILRLVSNLTYKIYFFHNFLETMVSLLR